MESVSHVSLQYQVQAFSTCCVPRIVNASFSLEGSLLLQVPQRALHGVDITGTAYVDRPVCLRAASFAARAHEGRCRKTGDPYVRHCIETAVITEQMMLHLFDPSGGDLTLRRCVSPALS